MPDLADLNRWCLLANTAAYDIEGVHNTCVQTSHALMHFLRLQGFEAEVFRAEAHAHCLDDNRCHSASAGWNGDGTRRRKSDGWAGHLAVSCGDYVLDPTLDQLVVGCGARPRPAVFRKPENWDVPPANSWRGGARHDWSEGDLAINHSRYTRQVGWKSLPASRQSRWIDILGLMLEAMRVDHPTHNDDDRPTHAHL
jgi:hypothetical protein